MKTTKLKQLNWVLVIGLIGLLSSPAQAAVRAVPSDYPSIQRAIDASQNGDTVIVSPGIYQESISFRRRAITLTSVDPRDPALVRNTVIRAVANRSAVTFAAGERSNSVITGFTITGGYGTSNLIGGPTIYYGGGIYCLRSSPTIVGNIITGNAGPTDPNRSGYGAGIGCIESDAVIMRNLITANSGFSGGGIMTVLGRAQVANNMIVSNSALIGGGVVLQQGGRLVNNTLVGNHAPVAGNVYAISDGLSQCFLTANIICHSTLGGGLILEPTDEFTQARFNNVWDNLGGPNFGGVDRTGVDGNISQDPRFVDAVVGDYRLLEVSPCINAGDPDFQSDPDGTDFYGGRRIFARRIDIGAAEYSDHLRPVADAGLDRVVGVTALPFQIGLDGSGSSDPNGASISFHWEQLSGPVGSFEDPTAIKPAFSIRALGTYEFALVVDSVGGRSFSDTVRITVKNHPPSANAGADQTVVDLSGTPLITLDGSGSSDPENAALRYHWRQIGGWRVQLSDTNAAQPTLLHPWPGLYSFSLVVEDGMGASAPDVVVVGIGPNHAPVADAGLPHYLSGGAVTLDGTRSYDPDGYGSLTYQWRQLSGPTATASGANTARPVFSGLVPRATNQTCIFELLVSDGYLLSAPSLTRVTVLANFGTNALRLVNPPFDPAKPTILAFGGGDCVTGGGMAFGGVWEEKANWLTVSSYAAPFYRYGDMLIAYLSSVAPDYRGAIQTMGHSTGNMPAMEAARHINVAYKDPRYAVNRVSLLDAVCGSLASLVATFHTNRVADEQCWVDNYVSYDPNYPAAPIIPGALNVVCRPARSHSYPPIRYLSSSLDYEANGLVAFAYLSVIGAGRNYQLNPATQKHYLAIETDESLAFFNESQFPGRILAPVNLTGPADGAILPSGGTTFGCEPVENAVRYQFLVGTDRDRVMDFTVLMDSVTSPAHRLTTLPHPKAWWTVRAMDPYGSSIYAEPRQIALPQNRPPIADPGPSQVVFAGSNGLARVTLDAARSTDPDGDPLTSTWAWTSGERAAQSNAVSLTVELPVGSHTVQLLVNDGQLDSAIAELAITVLDSSVPTLSIQRNGDQVILHWAAPAFSLQSAAFPSGPFTSVVGASNGYRVPASRSQHYFRLSN